MAKNDGYHNQWLSDKIPIRIIVIAVYFIDVLKPNKS